MSSQNNKRSEFAQDLINRVNKVIEGSVEILDNISFNSATSTLGSNLLESSILTLKSYEKSQYIKWGSDKSIDSLRETLEYSKNTEMYLKLLEKCSGVNKVTVSDLLEEIVTVSKIMSKTLKSIYDKDKEDK